MPGQDPVTTRLDELRACYRDGLLEDTLPFWLPRSIDREEGGFLTIRDRDGTLLDDDKGIWQQARFTWLLGELHNTVEPRPEWLDACRHGIEFLQRAATDPTDGRMWFHVTRDGRPIRKRRYAFSESFASIAFGEFAKAMSSDEHAVRAAETFERFANHEPAPKFTNVRPLVGIGVPMITLGACQELRDSIGYDRADEWIDRSLETIETLFVHPELRVVLETANPDGTVSEHADGRNLNPGHAIEGAWFVLREARHRDDARLRRLGCDMLDWMWERGWDREHGGMLYFVDLHGGPPAEYWHDMKFWWPHNETIIATLFAFAETGERRYAEWHAQVHDWAYAHFPDEEHGEWFGYLRRDGAVSSRIKGNRWKGPFHLPRMQLECWRLCDRIGRD